MRYRIDYHAKVDFDSPVSEQQTELRLIPRQDDYQTVKNIALSTIPGTDVFTHLDSFGNQVQSFSILPPHLGFELHFSADVENNLANPFDYVPPSPEEEREEIRKLLKEHPRFWDFILPTGETVPALENIALPKKFPIYEPNQNLIQAVQNAMEWIVQEIRYHPGTTNVHCPLVEVLEKRSGVCQDFSHLLIAILRHWGVPARYVMGYQYLEPGDPNFDDLATHAWTEVYLPGVGWRGFDAVQRLLANQTYIPVAVGRDSEDAAPERGSFKGPTIGGKPEIKLSLSQQ